MALLNLEHLFATIATISASFLFYSILKSYKKFKTRTPETVESPKGGGAWPIVGHLPLLGASKLPHRVLTTMAMTYGPIFTIKIGVKKALVISSPELARECLLVNDKAVAGRPKSIAAEVLCYNNALIAFGPHSSYWRHMRKIVMFELLSNQRLNTLSHIWSSEVKMFINDLYERWDAKRSDSGMALMELTQRFGNMSMNTIVRIVSGKRFELDGDEEAQEFHEALMEFFEHTGNFAIGDALPFLRWLDIGGQEKAMKKTFNKLDSIMEVWLNEHRKERGKVDRDFMDAMLSILDPNTMQEYDYDVDTINKANCLMMVTGGSDTTAVTLAWAVSLLLNNPHVLKKAQEELAMQVDKERQVEESDIPHLIYLQAVVKESLRLYPPAPLMGPREFIEDCTIGGYHIKTGTRLIVNIHKILRDPQLWEDPLEFKPERFLSTHKDVDVKGRNFEFIPFGSGRRMCPGMSFGLQLVHLALASFVHAFEVSTPNNSTVDMSERFGLTNVRATPLEVLIAPKLSSNAYKQA